ncbi:hypothetical protein HMPREF0972_02275 [Actinomyces sp. oral taxon 848 str. F0332]|nr:hypothetical protein HMPREF0972_02275 [Actinomyces sp. oral taxon 848 str. F0332]
MPLTCHALDPRTLVFASGSACLPGRPSGVEMPVLCSKAHFLRFGKPISCGKQYDDQVI